MPFVKLGMHAGMAGTYLLPDVVGEAHARDLLLTGRGRRRRRGAAARAGLPGPRPGDVPRRGARRPPPGSRPRAPIASRLTKLALADGGHADFESCLQWEALAQPVTLATADLQEGIRAAQEKRAPVFTGVSGARTAERGPRPARRHLPSPCESRLDGPGGLIWAPR